MKVFDEVLGIKAVASNVVNNGLPELFNMKEVESVRKFHSSMTGYKETPLVGLDSLAAEIGVKGIYVKDESHRFGLNAFKSLGGTYSIARILCDRLGKNIDEVSFDYFKSREINEKIKDVVFVTATDGNHGRGIAWAATQLGCRSVVFLPKGAAKSRVDAIKNAGAETHVTDLNYDDAVRFATQKGEENGWILVQDTAFEGYEKNTELDFPGLYDYG